MQNPLIVDAKYLDVTSSRSNESSLVLISLALISVDPYKELYMTVPQSELKNIAGPAEQIDSYVHNKFLPRDTLMEHDPIVPDRLEDLREEVDLFIETTRPKKIVHMSNMRGVVAASSIYGPVQNMPNLWSKGVVDIYNTYVQLYPDHHYSILLDMQNTDIHPYNNALARARRIFKLWKQFNI